MPPFPALLSTLHFRILASDITASLSPTANTSDSAAPAAVVLPDGVEDVNVKERRLEGAIVVQVLDVLDVGTSKWSQVEAIERVERGEEVRGREVIRNVAAMNNEAHDNDEALGAGVRPTTGSAPPPATSTASASASGKLSAGPHKLLLQDARGTKVLAFELVKVPKIGLSIAASASTTTTAQQQQQQQRQAAATSSDDQGMFIGCKLLLRPGTIVRRGIVMLTLDDCVVLGGKVEAWDRKWKEERKQSLMSLVVEENAAAAAAARG